MKVRWNARSLRLRITPAELAALERLEPVTERMGVGAWSVRLEVEDVTVLEAEGGEVRLGLSSHDFGRLCDPTQEGVYLERDGFKYYVEKDFPCEHPRAAAAQDALEDVATGQTFPRPQSS
jgi:hypothetical protein